MLPTQKKARLSSDAFAKSFNIHRDKGRELVAIALGKKSWIDLCDSIQKEGAKSVKDEQLHSIHEAMMHRISNYLQIEPNSSLREVIQSCSPFRDKPRVLGYDLNMKPSEDDLNLGELFDSVDMEDAFEFFKDQIMETASEEDREMITDLFAGGHEEMTNKMRISKPVEPYYYLVALDYFGLKASDTSFGFEHGKPVFHWIDENEEPNPVFINGAVVLPGDTKDLDVLNSILSIFEDSYNLFEKPMLLFGSIAERKINNDIFATIGIWFDGNYWRWLFLSHLSPEEQKRNYPQGLVNNLENTLLSPPPPETLAVGIDEHNLPNSLVYHCLTHPSKDPGQSGAYEIGKRPEISGYSGWKIYI